MTIGIAPASWAIVDEIWSTALGLPTRPKGWGLVMFQVGDHRWTWAGDPVMVTALDLHHGDLTNYGPDFPLEADGWPETVPPTSGPHSMAWRHRETVD